MNSARVTLISSLLLLGVLSALLLWNSGSRPGSAGDQETLLLYCAAGLKPAVEPTVRDYEEATGTRVQVQYAGSGTLLSNLKVAGRGDLYLAADNSFLESARASGIVAEIIPLARMSPVIAVAKGNPLGLKSLEDLLRPDVRLVLPNPEAAAIGKVARKALEADGRWQRLADQARAFKPTVNDLANDLKLGSADAVILWDATVRQYPETEVMPGHFFGEAASEVGVGVLTAGRQPQAALRFARFLGAPERGLRHVSAAGFEPVIGDKWVETPELIFFSGGVNRVAIEETLRKFEEREGVHINRIYNGCGILTAQIRAGQKPDGYFACDVSFMRTVADRFKPAVEMAETTMVIATPPGNPRGLNELSALRQPGLKIGVANEQQSALGSLTARLLRDNGLYDGVMRNVVVQTPTADLLVNQLRAGGLDAVVVYEANTIAAGDQIQVVRIDLPGSIAIQPVAINQATEYPRLMARLIETLGAGESKARFTSNGFRWREDVRP
ncbi:MAG TPA: substrate-binding domain-containing protein [Verrucomicrobiae bacterium]|nr:substrate-binding domain-containing protein [Verrucomicrobiae bacterium]